MLLPFQLHAHSTYWPPAAQLQYQIKAIQRGFPLKGEALIQWRWQDNRQDPRATGSYQIASETKVVLLGKILETRSEGRLNTTQLNPIKFSEKRLNKPEVSTLFDSEKQLIHFGDGIPDAPLAEQTQDRSSVVWQLAGQARNAMPKWLAGQEISLPVSSRRDLEIWRFKVIGMENLPTALGELATLHLSKIPSDANLNTKTEGQANKQEQQIDLWFAPGLEWYPARISFIDADGNSVEQTITRVNALAGNAANESK